MSMKKKFLALALAGMVAMPVVANASASTGNLATGTEANGAEGKVTINGMVRSNTGQAPAGRIEVELPTSMAFTVDQVGGFSAGTGYNVRNNSNCGVKVEVVEFTETQPSSGISIVKSASLTPANENRSKVSLTLSGDPSKSVELFHGPISSGTLFENIPAGDSRTMTLTGKAGTNTTNDTLDVKAGISEAFEVKFKISKVVGN